MQRITGLPDEQVLIYEAQAEAALRAALAAVMDKIARRVEASAPVLASALVLVAADGVEDQGDEVLPSSVPGGDGLPPGQPYVSPDDLASIPPMWQEAVASQVLPIVGQVFLDAAGRTYANMVEASSIAGLPSVGSLAAERYLAQARNTFEQIGDTLWAQARSELVAGFEAGESIPQLAERLRQSANVTARTGVLVARTQVNEASNAGSFETARASGLQMQKEWIATPDLRTRPTHLAADGQRVDLNEPFIVGGFSAMFPAAPTLPPAERYSCRCTQGYLLPDRAPAQVRADDLATQQLEELPGTTSVDDLAAAQSARLQQIIDEQHAAAEQVIEDVHQQFRDRFGKAAGTGPIGTYAPAFGDQTIGYIRPSLLASRSTAEFEAAWRAEMRAITGRDITLDALPADISVSTAREYAEAMLQMFEQFPEAKLRRISWHDDSAGKHASSYAHVERGSETISFNMHWARDSRRRAYLAALRKDVADWNTSLGTSWSVRGASVPQATVYHEFFHIIDLENLGDSLQSRVTSLLQARATAQGIRTIDELIASDISTYAGSRRELNELIAEAGTDVMVNGAAASQISREIFDLIRTEYRARGFAIRTTAVEDVGEAFPKAAAPRALSTQTVAQLRALAKERGIAIPAGARKADLVKALSDETPGAPKAMPSLEVRTSLSATEQKRVRTLIQRDPQIFATVQDRYGPVSTSGNLSDVDAAWLETIYKRDRVFVERVAQEAQIKRTIATEAKKLGITPTQYRAREAEKLKTLVDDKPIIVRRGERGLQDILASGRFKTSLETGRRQPGLTVAKDRRELGESVMGVADDVPLAERPVYGYVGIRGVEPALAPGKKIAGLAQREGQEDLLSTYGQIEIVLKPEVRARTTVTVGDSLDEIGFLRPSPIDAPTADSVGFARRLDDAISEPDWTRRSYVEAQIHGGLRREDILEVVFPDDPTAAIVSALRESGIPWRVLRKGDAPIFSTAPPVAPALDEKALLRAAARERNRLIESSQGTARLLAEVDELIANKATKAAIRQRLDPALIAPEQVFAGADPAIVEALRTALDTGDPAKLRAALTRAGTKSKLKPISKAGAKTKFDAETMEGVGGIDIPAGAQVTVVRRGTTLTLPDGSTMQLTRAQVTPVAPKPAPVKAARVAKVTPGSTIGEVVRGPTQLEVALGEADLPSRITRSTFRDRDLRGSDGVVVHRGERLPASFDSPLPAIRRGEFKMRPGLTPEESQALDQYVLSAVADPLNTTLRAGRTAEGLVRIAGRDVDLKVVSDRLDDAIFASELAEDTILYRGALMRPFDLGKLQPGAVTSESGFLSTTTDRLHAYEIIGWRGDKEGLRGRSPVLFEILAPKGTHGAVAHVAEREILLGRGRSLRVVDVTKPTQKGDVRKITFELMPDTALVKTTKRAPRKAAPKPEPAAPVGRVAPGPAYETRMRDIRRLEKAPETKPPRQLGGGSTSDVTLLTRADGQVVEKVYGRRVPGTKAAVAKEVDAEELAPLVVQEFGVRAAATAKTGADRVIMEFVDGETIVERSMESFVTGRLGEVDRIARQAIDSDEGRMLGLADYVMGNTDRNEGNWIFRTIDGRREIVAIDHGYAFAGLRGLDPPAGYFGEFLQDPAAGFALREQIDVNPADLRVIRQRLEGLRQRFLEAGRKPWHDAMMRRLKVLEQRADPSAPIRLATT